MKRADWIPVREAAEELGRSRMTVYRLIDAGKLDGRQIDARCWREVSRRSLDKLLAKAQRARGASA